MGSKTAFGFVTFLTIFAQADVSVLCSIGLKKRCSLSNSNVYGTKFPDVSRVQLFPNDAGPLKLCGILYVVAAAVSIKSARIPFFVGA